MTNTSDSSLGIWAVVSACFYLPLTFWATNAWEIGSPWSILAYGASLSIVGVGLFLLLRRLTDRALPTALAIAITLMVLMSWTKLPIGHPLLLIALVAVAIGIIFRLGHSMQRGIAVGVILFFGVASVGQVAIQHYFNSTALPTVPLAERTDANPTDIVEDVLVVVVDSYPSPAWAYQRYDHDTTSLVATLDRAGFTTPEVAWSQHANTSLSVSAMMELGPVVDTQADVDWGNSRNLHHIIGGESLVASALRSAGFHYTHIDSGWHLGSCSDVDSCIAPSWINETTWNMLESSIIGGLLLDRYGSWLVPSTLAAHQHLLDLEDLFRNGRHDYVYAHLMLPHEPYVVDTNCDVRPRGDQTRDKEAMNAQFACADSLIADIAPLIDDDTAVLITGDHGAKTRGQLTTPPDEWTELDIVDAFAVLSSYRMPESCREPEANVNTLVVTAIVECATDFEASEDEGSSLIGRFPHRWVTVNERARIEQRLLGGELITLQAG